MNSLSWMIYAAEVVGRMGDVSTFFSIGCAMAYPMSIVLTAYAIDMHDMTQESAQKWRRMPVIVGLIALPFAVLTPSSNTIYLIAASEAGETVIQSPEAREVFNDLKTIIKGKLKEQIPKP